LDSGVPPAWVEEVKAADEDSILNLAAHLPSEAAEAVLDIAVGVKPKPAVRLPVGADPFAHPDAQRRFRSMGNHEQLAGAALDFPLGEVDCLPSSRPARSIPLLQRIETVAQPICGRIGHLGTVNKDLTAKHNAVFLFGD